MDMKNPPHPGELIADNLDELGVTISDAAKGLGISRQQLHNVIAGRNAVTPEMAVRLEKALGSTADTWLRMQMNYDLAQVRARASALNVSGSRAPELDSPRQSLASRLTRRAAGCTVRRAGTRRSWCTRRVRDSTAKGAATMSSFILSERLFAAGILGGLAWAAPTAPAVAQQKAAPPDFSSNQVGWVGVGGGGPGFAPVPGHLPPVASDPAHPFVPNGTGAQPTYRIADLSNPNLKPWVKERMKKDNDEVLAGKIAFTARSSCMPAGVPGFMAYGGRGPSSSSRRPSRSG